jgi:hypothetical protein
MADRVFGGYPKIGFHGQMVPPVEAMALGGHLVKTYSLDQPGSLDKFNYPLGVVVEGGGSAFELPAVAARICKDDLNAARLVEAVRAARRVMPGLRGDGIDPALKPYELVIKTNY